MTFLNLAHILCCLFRLSLLPPTKSRDIYPCMIDSTNVTKRRKSFKIDISDYFSTFALRSCQTPHLQGIFQTN